MFLLDLWVRLTFGQIYPPVETSQGQVWNYFWQYDLWLDVPPVETSCGLVWNYFGKDDLRSPPERHLVAKFGTTLGRMTFDQMYPPAETSHSLVWNYFGQDDLWADVPPCRDISWPRFGTTLGRMTFSQTYPHKDIL